MSISMIIGIVFGAIGILTIIVTLIINRRVYKAKTKSLARQKNTDYFMSDLSELLTLQDKGKIDEMVNEVINNLKRKSSIQPLGGIEEKERSRVDELIKRIEAIESRFPKTSTLEKLSSVNDAILATQLETLSESIKTIKDRMLTKWDVAKTVFYILSALGILTGIIFGIISFVSD
jgi:ABC-type multidrug transport system fused ATPase/permease subunit